MLRVPPIAGAEGVGATASVPVPGRPADARVSRLADAAWMLESETALGDGLGRALRDMPPETAGPLAPRIDSAATGLIEKLFATAPDGVSDTALGLARQRAETMRDSVAGLWSAHDEEARPEQVLQALRQNLTGLFREGRTAGADAGSLAAAALGRIELLRGALPDEALAGLGGWSRGMAAAAEIDGALAAGDPARAEAALAHPSALDSLPDDVRREFTRRAAVLRKRANDAGIRAELQQKVGVLAAGRDGRTESDAGDKLDRAIEKAAASKRISDDDERDAFGWSLRNNAARDRMVRETRRIAVERSFRESLRDPEADPEQLFGLLDRAEAEGLLEAERISALRREQARVLERRAAEWRTAGEGARLLAPGAVFDGENPAHRDAIDAWWRQAVDGPGRGDLQPPAEEAGLFADIRSEDDLALPGADAAPLDIARDVIRQTGYLPKPLRGRLLTAWRTAKEDGLAEAAGLAADIATAAPAALAGLDAGTAAGLLLTAGYMRGGADITAASAAAHADLDALWTGGNLPGAQYFAALLAGDGLAGEGDIATALEDILQRMKDSGELRHGPHMRTPGAAPEADITQTPHRTRMHGVSENPDHAGGAAEPDHHPERIPSDAIPVGTPPVDAGAGSDDASDSLHGGSDEDVPDSNTQPGHPWSAPDHSIPEGVPGSEDWDGRTILTDPEDGSVLAEMDAEVADAVADLLGRIGFKGDFDSLSDDEQQTLIDALGLIPGIGEGLSALQAKEALNASIKAWRNGDYSNAALAAGLALIDGAGAIPGLGKTLKLAKLFGGFIARSVRKARRAAGHKPRGHTMSSAGDGYRGRDGKLRPQDRAPESAGAPVGPEPPRQPEKGPDGASRTTRTGDREIDNLLDKSDQDLVEMFEERVRPFRDRSLGSQKSRSTTKGHAHSLEELSKLLPPGATLEEKKHLFDLALDTNKTLRPNELEQAQRYFGNDISKVRRSSDPKVDYELEVADPKSGNTSVRKYDFVGGENSKMNLQQLRNSINKHLESKGDQVLIVLDSAGLSKSKLGREILDDVSEKKFLNPIRIEIL